MIHIDREVENERDVKSHEGQQKKVQLMSNQGKNRAGKGNREEIMAKNFPKFS